MATATYVLEVDWLNTGTFAGANDDVTSDLFSVECRRGREYASQLTGKTGIGRLVASLDNSSGDYSSLNASSPIYGNILPGRKVRLRTTAPSAVTLWAGFLDTIIPAGTVDGIPVVTLDAVGPLSRISGISIMPASQTSVYTGTVVDAILDYAEWDGGERVMDLGQTQVSTWYTDKQDALNAIREMEETELGFLYELENGYIAYEDRHHRLKGSHLISQETYTDAGGGMGYNGIEQQDPLKEIFNEITATVTNYTTAGSATVLWTLAETPTLAAGESKSFWAEYPNTNVDVDTGAYVDTWSTPVVGTDITQTGVDNSDIGVSTSKFANTMKITITNNHASNTATLTLVQAQGKKVTKNTPVRISTTDITSQISYGKRTYPLPAKWLSSASTAQDYTDYLVSRYKDAVAILSLLYIANASDTAMTEALTRLISDRITVVATGTKTKLGINAEFFVEAISHRISSGGLYHEVTIDLSDAEADSGYWILGTSELGINTKLAY